MKTEAEIKEMRDAAQKMIEQQASNRIKDRCDAIEMALSWVLNC